MRLIDADALEEKLLKVRDQECVGDEKEMYMRKYRLNHHSRNRITADIRLVRKMPTVEVERND